MKKRRRDRRCKICGDSISRRQYIGNKNHACNRCESRILKDYRLKSGFFD